jgi:hypothetical protein
VVLGNDRREFFSLIEAKFSEFGKQWLRG